MKNIDLARSARKSVATTATVGLAAAALSLGFADVASAGSGHLNNGVWHSSLTADPPATDFSVPGTTGRVSVNTGDGRVPSNAVLAAGDTQSHTFTLPAGLEFPAAACDAVTPPFTCTISANGRTLTRAETVPSAKVDKTDYNAGTLSFPVVATGRVWEWTGSVTYQPFPGLTSVATSAGLLIPGEVYLPVQKLAMTDSAGDCTLTGVATVGSTISVTDGAGAHFGPATPGWGGRWSLPLKGCAQSPLSVVETFGGVDDPPIVYAFGAVPVIDPVAGIGAVGAVLIAGAVTLVIRRRRRITIP